MVITENPAHALRETQPHGVWPAGETLANQVRAVARAAGLGEDFSRHSGRIGMARRMVAAGAPNAAVQRRGLWKHGDMVARYTRGEAAFPGAHLVELTCTTPTRCEHPIRHELGAYRNFPLIQYPGT